MEEAIKSLKNENEKCYEQCEGACSNVKNGKCHCRDAIILSAIENKSNLAEKIADFVINNWRTCPIPESDFICPSRFKKEGCRECFIKYIESLN